MSDLNKLLVHVPSSLCDDFRAKYIVDGANRDKSYDSKVVFLEDTKEIFTKGKIYGSNIEDFNALKELVGTIPSNPSGPDYDSIVEYIDAKFGELGTAAYNETSDFDVAGTASTIKTEIIGRNGDNHEVFIGDFFDNPSYTIWAVKNYADYVGANIIGSPVIDTYNSYTIFGSRKYADYVGENIEKNIPEIYGGTGINVVSAIVDGKKHYRISTSAKVFYYKGNKPELINLPSTGNTTGDVWSVGPAKSKGSTLYAWDGDEWINLGSASGVSGVNTTVSSYGIGLTNSYGIVGLKVTSGLVDSKSSYFVKGSTVYTAIEDAKKCSYAYTTNYINNLSYSYTSDSSYGSYVSVTVETKQGNVSYVGVEPTLELRNLLNSVGSAVQSVTVLEKPLYNGGSLTTDEAVQKLNPYFDTAGTAQSLINDLRGSYTSKNYSYFDVEVTSYQGEVSYVAVYEKENNILSNAISNANSAIQYINTVGYPYLTYYLTNSDDRFVNIKFDVEKVLNYVVNNIDFDKLSAAFKNKMLSYVVSNWVGYTGEVGILRD